jgi:hypothetical protein
MDKFSKTSGDKISGDPLNYKFFSPLTSALINKQK